MSQQAVPIVGLTGGMGAGKSTALEILQRRGAAVLSTDAVVHELIASEPVREALVTRFGEEIAPGGRARARAGRGALVAPAAPGGEGPQSDFRGSQRRQRGGSGARAVGSA
jgi:hypothetical protein